VYSLQYNFVIHVYHIAYIMQCDSTIHLYGIVYIMQYDSTIHLYGIVYILYNFIGSEKVPPAILLELWDN